jgi:hypothetical protein
MEASPPLSNTGPRKKTQTRAASEQALAWSGLPVVTIGPTVFLEGFFLPLTGPSVRNRGRIELPFGRGKFQGRHAPVLSFAVHAEPSQMALVKSTSARKPTSQARGGPTRRGEFASKRFLLRSSRPKGASESVQPAPVQTTTSM